MTKNFDRRRQTRNNVLEERFGLQQIIMGDLMGRKSV